MKLQRLPYSLLSFLAIPVIAGAEVNLPTDYEWTAISVVSENTWWVGNASGYILATEDNGTTFQKSKPTGETNPLHVRQIYALDERRAFMLTMGQGSNSRLYTTRNQGFSWQRLYRGKGDEQLRCFAMIPDGEAWIFADALYDNWHVIRSSNGRHWLDSRNGFAGSVQPGEQLSHNSDQCARFENNTWAAGTYHAPVARLIYKSRNALRFNVVDTPLTGGANAGIHAVWPLSENNIVMAGGHAEAPELYQFNNGDFTELSAPTTEGPLTTLFVSNDNLYSGNENGLWHSANWGETWNVATESGVKAFDCGRDNSCYALTINGTVIKM